jgi:hypothetical protein
MNQSKPTVVKNPYAKTNNPYAKPPSHNSYTKSSTNHVTNKVPLSTASLLITAVKKPVSKTETQQKTDLKPITSTKPEVPKIPNAAISKPLEPRTFDKKNPPSLKMKLKKEIEDLKKQQQRQKERLEAERHRRKLEKQRRKQDEAERQRQQEKQQQQTLPTPSAKNTGNAHVTPSPQVESSKESNRFVKSSSSTHPNMGTQDPPETPFVNSKAASYSVENAHSDILAKLENNGSSNHPSGEPSIHSHVPAPRFVPNAVTNHPTTTLAAPPVTESLSRQEHLVIADSMTHPLLNEPSSASKTSYNNTFALPTTNNFIPQIVHPPPNPFAHPMPNAAAMYSNPYAFSLGPWMPTWQQAVYQLQQQQQLLQQQQHFYYANAVPPAPHLAAPMNPWAMTMAAASMGQALPQAQSVRRTQKKKTPQQQDWRLISTPCQSPSPFARTHESLPYSIVIIKHAQDHKGFGVTLKKVAECALVGFDEWPMQELVPGETTKRVTAETINTSVSASEEKKVLISDEDETAAIKKPENADPQANQSGPAKVIEKASDFIVNVKDDRLAVLDTCPEVTNNDVTMPSESLESIVTSSAAEVLDTFNVSPSLGPDESDAKVATPLAATSVLDRSQAVADRNETMDEASSDPPKTMKVDSTTETSPQPNSSALSTSLRDQSIVDQEKMDEQPSQQSKIVEEKLTESTGSSLLHTPSEVKNATLVTTSSAAESMKSKQDRQCKRRRLFFCVMEVLNAAEQNQRNHPSKDSNMQLEEGDIILTIQGEQTGRKSFDDAVKMFASVTCVGDDGFIQCVVTVARRKKVAPPQTRLPKYIPSMMKNGSSAPLTEFHYKALATAMIEVARNQNRLLGHTISPNSVSELFQACSLLSTHTADYLLSSWESIFEKIKREMRRRAAEHWTAIWQLETVAIKASTKSPMSDAQRSSRRARPRPARGCRCGSQDHEYVNDRNCPLYSNLRRLKDDDSAQEVDPKSNRPKIKGPKDLNAVEKAFKERFIRMKEEEAALEAEAAFVGEMESIQLEKCGMAIFAPGSLAAMVLSAVSEIEPLFRGRQAARPIEPKEVPVLVEKETKDDSEDDDDDDVPLTFLGKRCANEATSPHNKKKKSEPRIPLDYLISLVRYVCSRWGHVYREPSELDYAW